MTKKELEILLSRIEGLKALLEGNSLEQFQKEILRVEKFLKRAHWMNCYHTLKSLKIWHTQQKTSLVLMKLPPISRFPRALCTR